MDTFFNRKAYFLVGFFMVAPYCEAGVLDRATDIFKFSTGAQVVLVDSPETQSSAVYVAESPTAEPRLLTHNRVTWFPTSSMKEEWRYQADPNGHSAIIQTEIESFIVTNGALSIPIPLDRDDVKAIKLNDRHTPAVSWHSFKYKGIGYDLLSYQAFSDESKGETFLVKSDGKIVKIDNRYHSLDKITIQDGVLSFSSAARQIDLERFEEEMKRKPAPFMLIRDSKGDKGSDPLKEVESEFGDLVAEARKGSASSFVSSGQEGLLEDVRIGLNKKEIGSVVILGEPGTGKTQLVSMLAQGIAEGRYPEIPRTTRMFKVDAAALGQGTQYTGQFETRVRALMAACSEGPSILFLDEIHGIRGQGTHSKNPNDFFQLIKPQLADGSIRIIGTSTEAEFYPMFGGDPALLRRFSIVKKKEPKTSDLPAYVSSWASRFRVQEPEPEVIKLAIRLSDEFNPEGAQPAKVTHLLSQAYSMMQIRGDGHPSPTAADIREAARKLYGVEPALFDLSQARQTIARLPGALDERVVGQAYAKRVLVQFTKEALANAQDPNKPAIRLLFVGPRGVGKTEIATAYAKALDRPFSRIEMNKYGQGGVEDFRRELSQAIRKGAFSVILLDEIEKAHPRVQEALLSLLDNGFMHVNENIGSGGIGGTQTVRLSFRNTAILATANAAEKYVRSLSGSTQDAIGFRVKGQEAGAPWNIPRLRAEVEQEISDKVLDRFQAVVPMAPLSREEFKEVVRIHVEGALAEQRVRQEAKISLANLDEYLQFAVGRFFQPGMSNRIANELAQVLVRSAVADARLNGNLSKDRALMIRFAPRTFDSCQLLLMAPGTITPET